MKVSVADDVLCSVGKMPGSIYTAESSAMMKHSWRRLSTCGEMMVFDFVTLRSRMTIRSRVGESFGAAEGDDVGAVAVGFVGAYAGDGAEFGEGFGSGDDEVLEDGVAEDDEGGFAGFGGFGFAPVAEIGFEGFLCGGVGGGCLFALGFEGGFGGFSVGAARVNFFRG